jgi:glycine/D-amino acid oxidase-like deaminating enzyme
MANTLYATTARPGPETPPLDGGRRVSVAIVGAGFTGLSTALHLAEHGVETLVLEAHDVGWGASGRNGGQVNPGLKLDPDELEARFGPDLGPRMAALAGGAPELVFDLIRRHQIVCEALQSGTLRTAFGRRTLDGLGRTAAQWARRTEAVSLLDRDTVTALTGTDRYLGALLDRRGGQLNPLGYSRGLAAAAIRAGAAIHGGTPVRRLRRDGGHWTLETPTGIVTAEHVVLATNGYTGDLFPGLARSVVPVFSAITASDPVPEAVMPSRSALYEMGEVTVYYRKDRDNRLLIGGRSVQREITSAEQLRYLADYAVRLWPALRGIGWPVGWSGQLAVTSDHLPHVHEPHETLLACLGYNGRGVAMSTAMGRELAARVMGGAIAMPMTSIRPIPLHGLWKPAVRARMVLGRMRDALGV